MHLGLFMMPLHPPERPMHETLAEDTEKSLLADRLGFQEVWVGEHFSATSEPIASPLMFMAGLVHRTSLNFGTGDGGGRGRTIRSYGAGALHDGDWRGGLIFGF
jgi:alkanesulfonate monooxygenase SsuD/methylene tetrahydromethanopterin reductase-like flavin-dependent oxidoreductase (luciferase family)